VPPASFLKEAYEEIDLLDRGPPLARRASSEALYAVREDRAMKHSWWHRFFTRVVPRDSQQFNNLGGHRLPLNRTFMWCGKCHWFFIVEERQ
jgi:hypothetical protein